MERKRGGVGGVVWRGSVCGKSAVCVGVVAKRGAAKTIRGGKGGRRAKRAKENGKAWAAKQKQRAEPEPVGVGCNGGSAVNGVWGAAVEPVGKSNAEPCVKGTVVKVRVWEPGKSAQKVRACARVQR